MKPFHGSFAMIIAIGGLSKTRVAARSSESHAIGGLLHALSAGVFACRRGKTIGFACMCVRLQPRVFPGDDLWIKSKSPTARFPKEARAKDSCGPGPRPEKLAAGAAPASRTAGAVRSAQACEQGFAVEVFRFGRGARAIFKGAGFEAAAGNHHAVRDA